MGQEKERKFIIKNGNSYLLNFKNNMAMMTCDRGKAVIMNNDLAKRTALYMKNTLGLYVEIVAIKEVK